MADNKKLYWIWFAEAMGAGSLSASKLLRAGYDPVRLFNDGLPELEPDDVFTEKQISEMKKRLSSASLDNAVEIAERCAARNISVITADDPLYPPHLKTIEDFPVVLYCRGKLPKCDDRFLAAIVGTRTMSDYGRKMAYTFGSGIAMGGGIIVSGMALGADSMALVGALEAGGQVIAVLGSGVDVIYPREHKELYYKITRQGAVISEYAPGVPPVGSHFPIRNRIMSGLSDAVVVIEAGAKSGSLITANLAQEQGRKLFAVPGKIGDSGSEGTNSLICDGAIPAITPEDIISEFAMEYQGTLSLDKAHARLRGVDFENLSQVAMEKTRIGISGGRGNYYGNGNYGGRLRDYENKEKQKEEAAKRRAAENESAEKVRKLAAAKQTADTKKKSEAKTPLGVIGEFFAMKNDNNDQKTKKQSVNSDKNVIPAKKIELDMLDEKQIKVYNRMKPNVPVLPDELATDQNDIAEIMGALTVLEMAGAVESGGGGYYMRTSPDDIMQSEND